MIATHLDHLTLSTGDVRRSPRSEVSEETMEILAPWIADGIARGVPVPLPVPDLARYSARLISPPGALLVTVYAPDPDAARTEATVPIATFGVAADARAAALLWRMLTGALPVGPGVAMPDATPWLVVALHPSLQMYPGALAWLGDFERAVAWAWIS